MLRAPALLIDALGRISSSGNDLMSDFGDRVRIKTSPETMAAELAGLEGDVHGFTTPSATGVTVVGGAPDDRALNVFVESRNTDFWLRPDLIEFLHFNAGSEIVVGNVRSIRQADGSWLETRMNSLNESRPGLFSFIKRYFKR